VSSHPRFSVVTPVFRPPAEVLRETIASVRAQAFADWELCLVDDASRSPEVTAVLDEAANADGRVRVSYRSENGGIVAATNDALAMAKGEFVAFLDHDDLLDPRALAEVAAAIDEHPDVDYVYTDEDKVDEGGRQFDPFFKPDWSIDRLRGQMYTCHLSVVRRSLVEELGGLRDGFDGSQDYDLVLRVTERARRIVHVRKVLYHWRALASSAASGGDAKPYAYQAGQRAIADHLRRVGFPAEPEHDETNPGVYRLLPRLDEQPLVSILIPTRGTHRLVHGRDIDLVSNCVRSIVEHSTYQNWELICVADLPTPESTLDELRSLAGDRLRVVPFPRPFNFSDKINVGAIEAEGDFLLLLNDDTEVIAPSWIESMVMFGLDPGVGSVGGRLRFADGRIQHVAIVGRNGCPYHPFYGFPPDFRGHFSSVEVPGDYLALTGACLLVRRSTFFEVGGFSPLFPYNFNDVDFCLKLHHAGLRNVYSPGAELYHYESSTRPPVVEQPEIELMQSRWGSVMWDDPFYNPRFREVSEHYLYRVVSSEYALARPA